jgi:hypothetical protein
LSANGLFEVGNLGLSVLGDDDKSLEVEELGDPGVEEKLS